jgi:hypothetical protein
MRLGAAWHLNDDADREGLAMLEHRLEVRRHGGNELLSRLVRGGPIDVQSLQRWTERMESAVIRLDEELDR